MKDNRTLNIAILLLIAAITVSIVGQLEALSVQDTCAIVQNGSFIGDPADCQGWVYCLNGEPYYGKCGDGLLYDSANGVCDYPSRVTCSANTTTMCNGVTNTFKADPFNCKNYCYCKDSVSYCQTCPDKQNYDPTTTRCVWATDSPCQASSPCLLAKNGFVKDPSSCSGWLRCTDGVAVHNGYCDTTKGLNFNANTGQCEYNVPCSLAPGSTPGNVPDLPTGGCGTYVADIKEYIADGATCRGYFYCTSTDDQSPQWAQCPEGSNFNFDTQQCNLPYTVACPHNRCDGVTNSFMAAVNTNCQEYVVCTNGFSGSQQECPGAYSYFNEIAQACQTPEWGTNPDYDICTKTVDVSK